MSDSIKLECGLVLPMSELEFSAQRSAGPGGQNVNKVATAIQLRWHIPSSSILPRIKDRLLNGGDKRISRDGVLVIKAQTERTQEANKREALARLKTLLDAAAVVEKPRVATKPSKAAKRRRVDGKTKRGHIKSLRKKPEL